MQKKQRVLFIDAGRMAEALFVGLLHTSKEHIAELVVSNQRNQERLTELREKYAVSTTTDWKQYAADVDVIVLAMPPEAHEQLLTELSPPCQQSIYCNSCSWYWTFLFRTKAS